MKPIPLDAGSSVAVVIPHLDRLADTTACCRSLAVQTRAPVAIFVVDNASQGHTEAELAASCPNARILRLETNRGFAGGVNVGIREVLAMPEIGFVWVLNNDTVCPPDTLAQLLAVAQSNASIGLVGGPLLEGSNEATRHGIVPGKKLKSPWAIPVEAKAGQTPDYLSGASLLIKRALLEDIGLFDEGFFFFFEDADLSRRAIENGWRLAVAANAAVEHRGSSTIRRMSELQARCYRAGHIRYLRKHSAHPLLLALPPFLFRLAADLFALRLAATRGNLQGWRAGWQSPLLPIPAGTGNTPTRADEFWPRP